MHGILKRCEDRDSGLMPPKYALPKWLQNGRDIPVLGQYGNSTCKPVELIIGRRAELDSHLCYGTRGLEGDNWPDEKVRRAFERSDPRAQLRVDPLEPGNDSKGSANQIVRVCRATTGAQIVAVRRHSYDAVSVGINDPYGWMVRQICCTRASSFAPAKHRPKTQRKHDTWSRHALPAK